MRRACVLALAGCWLAAASEEDDGADVEEESPSESEAMRRAGLAKLYGMDGERKHVQQGMAMLEDAAKAGSTEAPHDLAQFYESSAPHRDWERAFRFYTMAADKGHPDSQSALAYMYETGIGTEQDKAKSVLYHYFASTGGSVPSLMALGYKHMFGLGVPKSCDTAFSYYNPAAEQVIQEEQQPEGSSRFERVRLADVSKEGGASGREDEEIVEYYDYAASKGDTRAQLAMGQLNYWGARGLAQDFGSAAMWFERAASGGDAHAMSMLGHMYANGLSVEQSNETAIKWFTESWEGSSWPGAANGLGYLHMHGMGVEQDYEKALDYFVAASEKNNAEAHFNLGAMYIDGIGVDQDNSKALQHFAVAAGEGHTMALYNLAVMHHNGLGTSRSCDLAVQYLKNVVERGSWISVLQNASKAFDEDEFEESFRLYTHAAEQGVEMAQSNAAWILDRGLGVGGKLVADDAERYRLALHYYTLSAQQNNAESLLKLADYSYYGLGTEVDYEEAAAYYMQASEMRNAQAYFNLGYMHQFGHGLPQDFHLAKRFYDQTLSVSDSPEAHAPVILAIYGLQVAQWWSGARGSMPAFIVSAVESVIDSVGLGKQAAPGETASAGEPSGPAAAAADSAEEGGDAAARADGLWKAWSSFVADTMGWWDKSTESIRLALDPLTVKSTFGVSTDSFAVDSDVGLIIFLCLVLCGAVVQRWRQG